MENASSFDECTIKEVPKRCRESIWDSVDRRRIWCKKLYTVKVFFCIVTMSGLPTSDPSLVGLRSNLVLLLYPCILSHCQSKMIQTQMKWAAKLLFVGFLLICFPCCKAWNQQQKRLGSLILVYLYVCFLLLLPLLCGLTPSAHKNVTVIYGVPHSTIITHTPCHLHILEWSVCFQLHFSVKSVLELL